MTFKVNLHNLARQVGSHQPLLANSKRAPDKRRVSLRWLFGSIIIGSAALVLIGGSLHLALNKRQLLSNPAQIFSQNNWQQNNRNPNLTASRVVAINALEPTEERIIRVPTLTKVLNRDVISKKPFSYVSAPLAIIPANNIDYASFDPLKVFLPTENNSTIASDILYDTQIDSEITISYATFPLGRNSTVKFSNAKNISDDDIAKTFAQLNNTLVDNFGIANDVASDSASDGVTSSFIASAYAATNATNTVTSDAATRGSATGSATNNRVQVKITAQNVTTIGKSTSNKRYWEEVLVVSQDQSLEELLDSLNARQENSQKILAVLQSATGASFIPKDARVRVAKQRISYSQQIEIQRIGIYNKSGEHFASVALDDDGFANIVDAPPAIIATSISQNEENINILARAKLPDLYDGIFRAAMSRGLSQFHANQIVKIVAPDVDFKSTIKPRDKLEVFFSLNDDEQPDDSSEILFISLTLDKKLYRYYRFTNPETGEVRYYNDNGNSAKTFLLRKPVPNGRFESAFGMRIHPIFKVRRMHFGVDFAAPRGTPIIAAGDGVVTRARWAGGNGRHILIKHANGYVTSYSHLYQYAKGIKPGVAVKQGQIIGTVGSSGYSTGPHLHYEIKVNRRAVNPMKVRLPKQQNLAGEILSRFIQEKQRIDELIEQSNLSG